MTIQKKTRRLHCRTGFASLLLAFALLAGCSNDPIFSAIEQEVKLEDPSLTGIVTSLEVVGGDIYAANGKLFARTGGTGAWNKVSLPAGAARCSEIASDGTWLYARFTNSDHTSPHSVQRYNAGVWSEVTGVSDVRLIGSGTGRIYAFTGAENDYNLYVTPSAGSTAFNATAIQTGLATPTGTAGNYVSTTDTVYYCNGSTLAEAGGTDTSPAGITGIAWVSGTGSLYAVNSGYAWRFDGTTWTKLAHSLSTPTTGIAYLGAGKNLLLLASGSEDGGFSEVTLGTDGSLSELIDTPGDSVSSSVATTSQDQYENSIGQWALHRIFAVTGAVPAGNDYALYASVIHYSYGGLWSYYPATRSEWNRE